MNKYRITYTLHKEVVQDIEAVDEIHALSLGAARDVETTNELFRMIEENPDPEVKLIQLKEEK